MSMLLFPYAYAWLFIAIQIFKNDRDLLNFKYATESVRLQGRVRETWKVTHEWDAGTLVSTWMTTNAQVLYGGVDDVQYSKESELAESAILVMSVKAVDPDIPPFDWFSTQNIMLLATFATFAIPLLHWFARTSWGGPS